MQSVDKNAGDPFLAADYNDLRADVIAADAKLHFGFNFKDGTPWTSSVFGAGSPAYTFNSAGKLKLESGTSNGNINAMVRFLASTSANVMNLFDYNPYIFAHIQMGNNIGAGNTKSFRAVFGYPVVAAFLSGRHFGFEVRCDNGTEKLFATWGDGTTHSEQELSPATGIDGNTTTVYRCYAKLFSGSQILFYVNGVLLHTATTDLPSGSIHSLASDDTVMGFCVYPPAGTDNWYMFVLAAGFGWSGV